MGQRVVKVRRTDTRAPKRPRKQVVRYTRKIGYQYAKLVVHGLTDQDIAREPGMPTAGTLHKWFLTKPEVSDMVLRMMRRKAAREIARIFDIADDPYEHPQRSRLRVDVRKWVASKLVDGFQDTLQLSGDRDKPVRMAWQTVLDSARETTANDAGGENSGEAPPGGSNRKARVKGPKNGDT